MMLILISVWVILEVLSLLLGLQTIQDILLKGLVSKELSYDDEEKASAGDSDGAGSDKKAPSLNQEEEEAKRLE